MALYSLSYAKLPAEIGREKLFLFDYIGFVPLIILRQVHRVQMLSRERFETNLRCEEPDIRFRLNKVVRGCLRWLKFQRFCKPSYFSLIGKLFHLLNLQANRLSFQGPFLHEQVSCIFCDTQNSLSENILVTQKPFPLLGKGGSKLDL